MGGNSVHKGPQIKNGARRHVEWDQIWHKLVFAKTGEQPLPCINSILSICQMDKKKMWWRVSFLGKYPSIWCEEMHWCYLLGSRQTAPPMSTELCDCDIHFLWDLSFSVIHVSKTTNTSMRLSRLNLYFEYIVGLARQFKPNILLICQIQVYKIQCTPIQNQWSRE